MLLPDEEIIRLFDKLIPIGSVFEYYGDTEPENFKFINGSALSKTEYASLYELIGDKFRKEDNVDDTTFNLPDKRECAGVMYSADSDTFNELGKKIGEKTHILTLNEIPSHDHSIRYRDLARGIGDAKFTIPNSGTANVFLSSYRYNNGNSYVNPSDSNAFYAANTGGGQAHNNIQPSLVCNYIMRVK